MAEIFSWYYPQEIEMHSYDNGTSLPSRQGNWSQLQRVITLKPTKLSLSLIFNVQLEKLKFLFREICTMERLRESFISECCNISNKLRMPEILAGS